MPSLRSPRRAWLDRLNTIDDAVVESQRLPHVACRACHYVLRDETPRPLTCERCGAASWVYLPTGFNGWSEAARIQTVRQLLRMMRLRRRWLAQAQAQVHGGGH